MNIMVLLKQNRLFSVYIQEVNCHRSKVSLEKLQVELRKEKLYYVSIDFFYIFNFFLILADYSQFTELDLTLTPLLLYSMSHFVIFLVEQEQLFDPDNDSYSLHMSMRCHPSSGTPL